MSVVVLNRVELPALDYALIPAARIGGAAAYSFRQWVVLERC